MKDKIRYSKVETLEYKKLKYENISMYPNLQNNFPNSILSQI